MSMQFADTVIHTKGYCTTIRNDCEWDVLSRNPVLLETFRPGKPRLCLQGLTLEGPGVTRFPDTNLCVEKYVELIDTNITEFPEGLSAELMNLSGSKISALSSSNEAYELTLTNLPIRELPDWKAKPCYLDISGTQVTELSDIFAFMQWSLVESV